jgi:hypothetical protein
MVSLGVLGKLVAALDERLLARNFLVKSSGNN